MDKLTFNNLFLLIHRVLCTITSGICNIIATNPYPLNFFVIHPITSSCASALTRNVITVAIGRDKFTPLLAEYTCLRKKWCTGIFHSRENSSQSQEFHQSA